LPQSQEARRGKSITSSLCSKLSPSTRGNFPRGRVTGYLRLRAPKKVNRARSLGVIALLSFQRPAPRPARKKASDSRQRPPFSSDLASYPSASEGAPGRVTGTFLRAALSSG